MRKFLDTVRADLTALLVTAGATPAPSLNALLIDVIDSSIDDEALISSNVASAAIPTATTWTPLTTGIYDVAQGGDGSFLTTDAVAGTITSSPTAGFTYNANGLVSFTDIATNTVIEFSILRNGVPFGYIASITGGGGARPRSVGFEHTVISAGASDVFTIGVQTPAGATTVDISSIGLGLTIKPTNNP